jgi:hypothetical protein
MVILTYAAILGYARRNQASPAGGTLELTEQEAPLVPQWGESTVTLLHLRWEVESAWPGVHGPAAWIDALKLRELGIDCSLPVTDPLAARHYASQPPVRALVVLELAGEAWQRERLKRELRTRLFVVDAGLDPVALRQRYPDPQRHVLAVGLIRPTFVDRASPGGERLAVPRIGGRVVGLLPSVIFVPRPHAGVLREFRSTPDSEEPDPSRAPHCAVALAWGTQYTPWVTGARRMPPGSDSGLTR